MASIIMDLVKKYRKQVDDQDNWQLTKSEVSVSDVKRSDLIAHHFMTIVSLLCIDDNQISKLNEEKLSLIVNKLLWYKSSQQKIKASLLKRVFGLFIKDTFNKNLQFQGILSQFKLGYEEEDNIEQDMSQLSILSGDITNYWQQHIDQVKKYLLKLNSPQVELEYICQNKGWKWIFTEDSSNKNNQFLVLVKVSIDYKTIKQEFAESHQASNKKHGRMFSSLMMIKKIYVFFPQIWKDISQKIKDNKSISLNHDLQEHVKSIIEKIISQPIEIIPEAKELADKFEEDKKNYLTNVSSFIAERTLLSQQIPGALNFLKTDRVQNGQGGQWVVTGQVTVKYQDTEKEYKKIVAHTNSKNAEKLCAQQMIKSIYEDFPGLLEKMLMIKQEKKIVT